MQTRFKPMPLALALVAAGAAATSAPAAFAQDAGAIEEVVITGLRGTPRSAVDSAVPIDTFNVEQIQSVSNSDTVDILQTLVPSFNVNRQPISDGASFIRPVQMRGLDSHHALVLVNGKRRHRAALVQIGGAGTQGPDVATIPASAIQSIEVLRDGASSQYGSDAIAGVINFNLKENREGFDLTLDTGQFYEGDGTSYTVQGNIGLPLGESGFISFSGEINDSEFTERAEQYCESWFCLDTDSPRFSEPSELRQGFVTGTPTPGAPARVQALQQAFPAGIAAASVEGDNAMPWGIPNRSHQMFFVNAGYDLANGMELYAFGNYGAVDSDGGFFYRYPGNGTIEDLRNADGSIYSPLEKFPGGFTPRFEGEVEDLSIAGGLRGSISDNTTFDLSARFGSNEIDYRLFNTINPSLGPASPTDFRPGSLTNEEAQFQLDFVTEFDVDGLAGPLVFAYGASYLDETYDVGQSSQPESYEAGPHAVSDPFGLCNDDGTPTAAGLGLTNAPADEPLDCANPDDPVFQVVGVGSNGFPGYSPEFSEEYTRDSYAFYGDLSADVTDQLLLQGAIRFEDYSDFGNETVGKLAARYRLTDVFALRGSFGTGFRAPTPGQQGTTNVSTRLPNGFPVATGLFPAGGTVAQALGAQELAPETSTSFTVGFTAELGDFILTFDAYRIDIDDRFRAISTLDVSADPSTGDDYERFLALQAAGVVGAESIGGVNYFQNAIDTETQGFDLVAEYGMQWNNGHSTDFSLALNYNEQEIVSDELDVLNPEGEFDLENQLPNTRWNATAFHTFGDFSIMARARYFGEWDDSDNTSPLSIQTYDPVVYFDLEGSWQLTQNLRATLGGRNLFDEFPDQVDRIASDNDYCCGRIYPSTSVADWQGGYYYLRLRADF